MTQPRLMLLDTAALYFRAFHGVPDSLKAPDGTPVNAVRGLLDMIARLVSDFRPTELVACWDDDWRPQWRVDLLPTYKTHRVAEVVPVGPDVEVVPDPLTVQVPIIVETLDALGIPIVGKQEYEADDIIGTLAATATIPVDVVTGDRDLFQVVDDDRDVRVIYTARGMSRLEIVTNSWLEAKYGVSASQYVAYAVLRGDASDGLPGVSGIGEKTAASLVTRFGDLDGILAAAAAPDSPLSSSIAGKLLAATDYIAGARRVVAVRPDLELPPFDAAIRLDDGAADRLRGLREKWGLGGSVERVLAAFVLDPNN